MLSREDIEKIAQGSTGPLEGEALRELCRLALHGLDTLDVTPEDAADWALVEDGKHGHNRTRVYGWVRVDHALRELAKKAAPP